MSTKLPRRWLIMRAEIDKLQEQLDELDPSTEVVSMVAKPGYPGAVLLLLKLARPF